MSLLGLGVYIVLWWLSFFVMLPIGVKSAEEAGLEHTRGADRGAPAKPNLARKALYAAVLAAVLWGVGYALFATGVISLYPDEG